MKLSRPSRWYAALVALISMLFMQLAVAAYACPELGVGRDTGHGQAMMAAGSGHEMSSCQTPDPVQPALCHAHGQVGKQSLDKPELPPVQPFMAVGLAIPLHPVDTSELAPPPPAEIAFLARTTAPPLTIRNCCFRI